MPDDLPLARRDLIAARLAAGQSVGSVQLAEEFGVSEDAIRRDLRALAAEGRCRRVYGGALPLGPAYQPLRARLSEDVERKRALAAAAAGLVERGSLIFLDAGSTHVMLVDALPDDMDLTIATNAVDIAAAIMRRPDIQLIVIGGAIDPTVGGAIDAAAVEAVSRLSVDHSFIGICGVSAAEGVNALHFADANFKRAVMGISRRSHALVANEKFGLRAPYRIAPAAAFTGFVVEHNAPQAPVADIAALGPFIVSANAPA